MAVMLGVTAILLALLCYSIGVWSQGIVKMLKPWHLVLFWAGLVFDAIGTGIMTIIAGAFKINVHGVTGIIAFALMALNAIWASIIIRKKNERLIFGFYRVSLAIWIIWLIPFFTGVFLNMK